MLEKITNNRKQEIRDTIYSLLHGRARDEQYDNSKIWAGNMRIEIDGEPKEQPLARVFLDTGAGQTAKARVFVEFFCRGVTDNGGLSDEDIDARLWLDFNEHGYHDERGFHHPPLPKYEPMTLLKNDEGGPARRNGSVTFASNEIEINNTGVFHYTTAFSADHLSRNDPTKDWVTVNEISDNRDGLLVVTHSSVRDCPSITEICLRKYGAKIEDGRFVSGKIKNLTEDLENISTEVIYLLPFFLPGTKDAATGEDVRKGALGSIYAVKDFFRIDPLLVSNPMEMDIDSLVTLGLITDRDLWELLTGAQQAAVPNVSELCRLTPKELLRLFGEDTMNELVGRAELRWLTQRAHSLGKRVIFDLVLMQTSRDCPLIFTHLEWYSLDENRRPKRHKIAWLDYTDVALFDLKFNKPLQNYLSSIAPYWISTCGFDGVRIDASQTVDRPFLKQIKNRINQVKPDAIVLGETLCPMSEAADVPADMIYTLLVDHHLHITDANSYFNLFETIHASFARGTVGMAYFENHDSARATFEWHKMYNDLLRQDSSLFHYWATQAAGLLDKKQIQDTWDVSYFVALLKNIMSSLIDCSAGTRDRVSFAYAVETGSDYGEEQRTDFEQDNLLYMHLRGKTPHSALHSAYKRLAALKTECPVLHRGSVYYLRNGAPGTDVDDRILAYVKFDETSAVAVACNLDPTNAHQARYKLDFLDLKPDKTYTPKIIFDTYGQMKASQSPGINGKITGKSLQENGLPLLLPPLSAVVISIE